MKPGDTFKHYKGDYYKIIGVGRHANTGVKYVYYKDSYEMRWIRTIKEFNSVVKLHTGHSIQRFSKVMDDPQNPFQEKPK